MLENRLIEILMKSEEERCDAVSNEFSCGKSIDECKRCRMRALNISEEEYNKLFNE